MAFSINPNFSVRSFTDAETKYHNITPIRGNANDIRPIGDRRAQHMRIVKLDNGDAFACRLYNTDVVTYHRDGRVVLNTGGWDTMSTANFLHSCLPYGWYAMRQNNHVHVLNENKYYIVGRNQPTINTNTGEVTDTITPTKQVVDRAQAKENRALFTEFLKFAQGYIEVLNLDIPDGNEYSAQLMIAECLREHTPVPEEKYLELLANISGNQKRWDWEPKTYKQIKAYVYKSTTPYVRVDLPIGSLQGR